MFDDVLLFVTLVEVGNFSQTAIKLNLTQATISRRLKHLEDELDLKLIKRNTRNFEITPAGNKLYNGFRYQRAHFQQLIQSLKDSGSQKVGKLRVSLPPGIAYEAVSPFVAEFLQQNPGISLDLCFQNREIDLISEDFDLAIISHIPKQQTTKVKLLHRETVRLYCTPAYLERYGLPDLLDYGDSKHLYTGYLREDFTVGKTLYVRHKNGKEFVIENVSRLNSNNALQSRKIALSGHAIALGWDSLYKKELKSGEIINILPEYTFRELSFYLIRLPENESAIANIFIKFVEQCFKRIRKDETEQQGQRPKI